MAGYDDNREPLLREEDQRLSDYNADTGTHISNGKLSNGNDKYHTVVDIGPDRNGYGRNSASVSMPEETSSIGDGYSKEDQGLEEEIQEVSASADRRYVDEQLHGLYGFLGDPPQLGPMPTVDPFKNQTEDIGSLYEYIKLVLCLPLAIVRFLLVILITVLGILVAKIVLLGWKQGHLPMPKWRRKVLYITRLFGRFILFCFGYQWIKRTGKQSKREVAPIIISNHVSFIDPIFFFYELFPSFVSSASHSDLPGIGMIIRPMQVINVDRSSPESKKEALKEIKSKATSNIYPHVMIFPEGTTTNGRALIFFQLGAFIPGLPVQPVILRYPFVHFDNSWGRISLLKVIFRMLTQFHNFMEVEYLPVVYPSAKEKEHPSLFAKRVKRIMAQALNVAETNHNYGDLVLSTKASEVTHTSSARYMVEMAKMEKLFHVSTREATVFLERFQEMDSDNSGRVSEENFMESLHLPRSKISQQIFGFFDREEEGSISFREYLAGSAFILKHPSFGQLCRAAFVALDRQSKGFVSNVEMGQRLQSVFPDITPSQVEKLWMKLNPYGDQVVHWDDFRTFLEIYPEMLIVFLPQSGV